jgi:hypothetical protein
VVSSSPFISEGAGERSVRPGPTRSLVAALLATTRVRHGGAACAVVLVAACATPRQDEVPPYPQPGAQPGPPQPAGPAPPSLGIFSRIKAPDAVAPAIRLAARGVQVFRCEARPNGYTWVFRLPEADLFDDNGKAVARHGANFSFEHADGSRVLGTVVEFDEAPDSRDLRWLLLSTRSFGDGALGGVTHVQRVNTAGGMPPARCEPSQQNRLLRVDFSADFIFYRPR